MENTDETIEIIHDFLRETEESLETLEENVQALQNFVFELPQPPTDFEIQSYINFFQGLNVDHYLEILRTINRTVHTIKGTSAFIDLNKINKYCHTMEELTINISKGSIILDHRANTIIGKLPMILNRFLEKIKSEYSDSSVDVEQEIKEIDDCTRFLMEIMKGTVVHLDEIHGKDFGRVRNVKKSLKVSIDLSVYDDIINKFQAFIQESQNSLRASKIASDTIYKIRKDMTEHLDSLISSSKNRIVLSRYPRIVKDLGMSMGKKILFEIKRNEAFARPDIWDRCHNALVHIVRNSVDHGIENESDRLAINKDPQGLITMDVWEDFKNIYIVVEDDGRGIDSDKVSQIALKKGIIKAEELNRMNTEQKQKLIFKPGFSTKDSATDVSGRGVGMDAVHKEIEVNLNGKIKVDSIPDTGTKITLEIPKAETLSECIIFGNEKNRYAIPMVKDIEYLDCNPDYMNYIFGKSPIYTEKGVELPILNLFSLLHPEEHSFTEIKNYPIIKIGNGQNYFGLLVPGIIGQERINIDRSKKIKRAINESGLVFGYGLTDPITIVLDLDHLENLIK